MSERIQAEAFPPGEYLKDELEERGWTQEEFASIIGRPAAVVNQIISGKRGISPETAREIGAALGTSAIYWMNLEAAYRLWHAGPAPKRINQVARIRELYPVREMLKRGWLKEFDKPEELEAQVKEFFGIKDLAEEPKLMHAAKKTGYPDEISGAQRAWLFRVRQVASALEVAPYSRTALRTAIEKLRGLRGQPDGIAQVPKILADCGVRFVIVEHVPASKIDGVCFWLSRREPSPVIGMSLRLDRIDNFWFVLRHEIEHVLNEDGREVAIVDVDTLSTVSDTQISMEERRANRAASDFCVPNAEMADFIIRHEPMFAEHRVVNFANRMGVHPGLVVGQLQWRTGNYKLFRKHLVSVRPIITPVAVTDGYGQVLTV
jgi:HTH-type transcriptional regulator / antitoxin HigA